MMNKEKEATFDFFIHKTVNEVMTPVNYRLMQKLASEDKQKIKLAASTFHQTKAYSLSRFYKPITPWVNFLKKNG